MRARDFKTFSPDNDEVGRLQDNVGESLFPLISAPMAGHIVLNIIELDTTPLAVPHKLGTALQGWIVISKDAPEDIYEISRNKQTVTLQATGPVTISLAVF